MEAVGWDLITWRDLDPDPWGLAGSENSSSLVGSQVKEYKIVFVP